MIRFAVMLSLIAAAPLAAQDGDGLGRRVGKLESEMRAVQRKVFPGGDARFFEPEVSPVAITPVEPAGSPASAPLTDLTARVGELEAQLRTLTGQVEAGQNRLRLLEEGLAKFRGDAEFRLGAIEAGAKPPAAAVPVEEPGPLKPAAPTVAPTVEGQWRAAYALVTAKDPGAADALTAFVAANPKAARASDAQYWLGKTESARKQHAAAARAFLDGYTNYPRGARAPDSLMGLAQALIDLKKPDQACRSLTQLDEAYGAKLSPALKAQAAKARVSAKCAA